MSTTTAKDVLEPLTTTDSTLIRRGGTPEVVRAPVKKRFTFWDHEFAITAVDQKTETGEVYFLDQWTITHVGSGRGLTLISDETAYEAYDTFLEHIEESDDGKEEFDSIVEGLDPVIEHNDCPHCDGTGTISSKLTSTDT